MHQREAKIMKEMLILLSLLAGPTLAAQTGSSSSVPVFLQEPEPVYYLIRGGAVTITCRAAPAVQINIKCGGQWVSPSKLVNSQGIDSLTSVHFLETSVELEEEDVTDEYTCDCYAWNSVVNPPLSARSKPGRILTAKMPKRFEQEPIGSNVEVGTTVRLQCLPPEGIPPPKVFWLRNGEVVDVEKEINFIISHEGSLIINQARLTDSANYTCGAQNMAGRRLSESAALNVYMNGGWSSWSQWSECGGDCVKSVQRRNRQCNNPSPVNGGVPCSGEYVQKLACTSQCKVDGAWSTWSSWSPCSVDCQQRRRRQCNNPAPSNNGLYCNGTELDSIECTGDRCIVISDTKRGDVALYAGLAVAVVVFILVVILVVRVVIPLLRRRKSRSEGFDSKSALKLNHDMLGPDVTKTMPVMSPGRSSSGSSSCSTKNESPNSYSSCADSKAALRESKQRLIPCHTADTSLPLVQQYQTKSLPTNEKRSLIMTSQLPPNIDPEALVWSVVGSEGARLTLPDSGISLLIPEGAIDEGMTSEVYLAVSRDDKDRPKLNDSQTVVSAVILCGPSSLRLRKSAILSFPHCASVNHGQWSVSAYSSDPISEAPTWNHVCTLGEETLNTSVYVQMDHNQCHLMTESLSRYALIGQPCAGHTAAVKVLRLAVFAPQVPSPMDFNLRVYCVEDIKDALEGVLQIEKRLGGYLLDKPKQMLFQYCGANLCLTIEEQGAGWRCKMAANYQEIPFRHIWSGTQNGLHCSFALEQQQSHERHLTCDIHVFQAGLLSNRQILRISHDLNEHHGVSSGALSHNSVCNLTSTHRSPNNTLVTSGYSPPEHPAKTFRLYGEVKREFCQILDPPNTRGNDWRLLARHLGVDRYINYFATKMSPTEHILDLWEARHNEATALSDLIHTLKVMGRTDAASFLEEQQNHHYQTIGQWV